MEMVRLDTGVITNTQPRPVPAYSKVLEVRYECYGFRKAAGLRYGCYGL